MYHSKLSDSEKELITKRSKEGVSTKDIAAEINRSYDCVKRFENKANLPSNPQKQGIPFEYYDDIFALYNSGLTLQQIHDQRYPQFSADQINYICRQKGITRPNARQAHFNEHYFSIIDSDRKAYWLGLLMADGCVQHNVKKGNSYSTTLDLMADDKYIVEQFAKDVETNLSVRTYTNKGGFQRQDGKPHSMAKIVLNSPIMAEDLAKYGIVPHKSSLNKHLPLLDEKYMNNFMLGYFDGNGSVTYELRRGIKSAPKLLFYGDHVLISDINEYLEAKLGIKKRAVIDQKNENVSFITYARIDDSLTLYHYFYDNASMYCKRKKDKFEELLRQYRDNRSEQNQAAS